MKPVKIAENVHWIGVVDWTIRDFHGYETKRGSTYNSYLIQGGRTAIVDTVKAAYAIEWLSNAAVLTDLAKVDYLICHHAEPDHSGSLPTAVQACPNAAVVCTEKCREALGRHFDISAWKFHIVKTGEKLDLGGLTLTFVETPMAHWPESTASYLAERWILFSMDAFGQHYATSERFADQRPWSEVLGEMKTYYANILMPYPRPVLNAVEALKGLTIDLIAPSHGVIFRGPMVGLAVNTYRTFASGKVEPRVLVIYDSMWQSTERMAKSILQGAAIDGVDVKLIHVRHTHITDLVTEALDAAALAVGSPTLNMGPLPEMAAALTYLSGLRPPNKCGFAFGSYGWGKGGPETVEEYLKKMQVRLTRPLLRSQFAPTMALLAECQVAGEELAREALKASKL